MGSLITWVIATPIIAFGIYTLVKTIKNGISGGGCDGCSGCGSEEEKTCRH